MLTRTQSPTDIAAEAAPLAELIRSSLRPLAPSGRRSAAPVGGLPKIRVRKLPVWTRLDTDIPTQEQTQWCWCATSLGVHDYYDRADNTSQCQAANLILGATNACTSPTDAAINKPWFLDQAFDAFGNLREPIIGGTLGFTDIKAEVNRGTPLGTRIGWSGGGGHFMVMEAFRSPGTQMVAIDDPIYGQSDISLATYSTAYQGSGSWTHSYKTKSQRLRILDARSVAGGIVSAVARKPHLVDLFMVDNGGRVMSAASDETWDHGRWRGWWHLQGGMAQPGSRVACVARQPDMLDIFIVGNDGGIWTAAWDANQANAAWRGWWRIGDLTVPKTARIAAVSRHPDKLDIFVVDGSGRVMSAAWQAGDTAWRGWWHIAGGMGAAGAAVSAVSRDPNKLDVFVVGTNGGVYTAAWDQNVANAAWRGWWRIGTTKAKLGAPVTAVCRDPNKLDVFITGSNQKIYTAAWDQNVANGAWRGWWSVKSGKAVAGTAVPCAARTPDRLDIAVVGLDGGLYTAAWDQAVANAAWRGWWRIGEGTAALGSETALISRGAQSLDGFCVGADGFIYTYAWNAALAGGHWRG